MEKKSIRVSIIMILSFFIVSIIGMSCTYKLNASGEKDSGEDYPVIVEHLAKKLDIDPEKVLEAFKDINQERKEKFKEDFEKRLDKAVEEGVITEEQREAIIAKREEIAEEMQEIEGMSQDEKREAIKDMVSELKEWAEDNDIDYKDLLPAKHIKQAIKDGIRAERFKIKHNIGQRIFEFFRR